MRGLDLDVGAGERVLLLAPSGAGKSTVLAGVAGLLDPSPDGGGEQEGELLVDGVPAPLARLDAVGAADGHARTGMLLQDPQAQTILARCGDDVAFGLENHAVPPAEIWPRVERALESVDLRVGRDHPTARLSGGQRQRLALAGVLALRPDVLLLDEPTAMLDPAGADRLRSVVAGQLARGGAGCVIVEHRVALWADVVDRVVVLAPGAGVVADGPLARVFAEHGDALADQGVWVPGRLRVARARRAPVAGATGASTAGATTGTALLELSGAALGRRSTGAPVLTDVHATVSSGRVAVLRGVNGAGKSTLALALAGLTAPTAGRLSATGALLTAGGAPAPGTDQPVRWRPRELVARIGSVFQDPRHQFVAGTVTDELAVGPRRLGVPEVVVQQRVGALLERLRLSHLAPANPFTLSGGEQRRLSVGTALVTAPPLLVLDEPTFGQDARTWREVVDLLVVLRDEGSAVVAATHDEELAEVLADEVWDVSDGAVAVRAA